jgi:hypothetical protein
MLMLLVQESCQYINTYLNKIIIVQKGWSKVAVAANER